MHTNKFCPTIYPSPTNGLSNGSGAAKKAPLVSYEFKITIPPGLTPPIRVSLNSTTPSSAIDKIGFPFLSYMVVSFVM